ncbi:MAG: S41 family peptidase [Pirellulales bacterium]
MPRRTLWLIFAVVVVSLACYERADRNPYGRWFAEVLDTIDRNYVEPVDEQKLFEGALDGVIGKLDEYSAFLSRNDAPQFQQVLDQQYGGIGIEVTLEGADKQLTVMSPFVGTPAYKAGVRAGDTIVAIDGRSTKNRPLNEIVRWLKGRPGDPVAIEVVRKGHEKPLRFDLVRAKIRVDSVLGDLREPDGTWNFFLPGEDKIGYVRITAFGESTVEEFTAALQWLSARRCRGLILDLRNDPGGLLEAAKAVCDLFLPEGAVIVSTRGRDARIHDEATATGAGEYQSLPLVVLVNDKSASAAEIVAACMQDHKRAAIVGERTWGKGTVQNVIPLEGGRSLLKLTIASYWRPSGKNIHRLESSQDEDEWGVKADPGCELKLDDKQTGELLEQRRQRDVVHSVGYSPGEPVPAPPAGSPADFDPQLTRAVEVLKERLGEKAARAGAA